MSTAEKTPSTPEVLLRMDGISKSFAGTKALKDVSLTLHRGTVHALMGENGAGKSTLMKILAGILKKDEGHIIYKGQNVQFNSAKEAHENGISMIHQELSALPHMTVQENLFLGRELHLGISPILDWGKMRQQTKLLLDSLGLTLSPDTLMRDLTVSQMQMVEIAKAVSVNAEIIIMDEPTSAITTREVKKLFAIIQKLKNEGRCIIYITHKMDEVFQIADQITIFRDGSYVGTYPASSMDDRQLIRKMVDRELEEIFPAKQQGMGDVVFEVENLSRKGLFSNVSFQVRKGEILGIAGLMGAGRTEVVESIFGIYPLDQGKIRIRGNPCRIKSPKQAITAGVALITEDRKKTGLVLGMSILDNITLPSTPKLSRGRFLLQKKKIAGACDEYTHKLRIKMGSPTQAVKSLSGGNQQKVVLAKWLMMKPDILIFDEPTRGIDVGAKAEFYRIITDLAAQGVAIVFISSEMQEILGMCHRIIVMHEGTKTGDLLRAEATQEILLAYATGIKQQNREE